MIINSGVGNAYAAAVDETNRIKNRAINEPGNVEATVNGDQYFVTCGEITLTNANASSAIIYYQNDEEFDLLFDKIIFSASESASGTGPVELQSTINPTGMTSGSSTEAIDINTNFGSSKTLTTTNSEIGAQGASLTGGTSGPKFYFPTELTSVYETSVLLPRGTSVGFSVTTPNSNTSITVSVAIELHRIIGV